MQASKDKSLRLAQLVEDLCKNEALAAAINACEERALVRFKTATTPDEAWHAHLDWRAKADFVAVLRAFLSEGAHAAELVQREQETLRKQNANGYDYVKYTQQAALARKEWAKNAAGLNTEDVKQ